VSIATDVRGTSQAHGQHFDGLEVSEQAQSRDCHIQICRKVEASILCDVCKLWKVGCSQIRNHAMYEYGLRGPSQWKHGGLATTSGPELKDFTVHLMDHD
jgi:hypothetical protein